MKDILSEFCSEILKSCDVSKIILYGEKYQPCNNALREINLCLAVNGDPGEAELKLYKTLDADFAFNLLVYSEDDFNALISDPTSYASSIMRKGTVLHG